MGELAIGAVVVVGIVVAIVATLRSGRRSRAGTPRINLEGQDKAPTEAGEAGSNTEAATVEHSKLVIHALLESISANVEGLLEDSSSYGDALDRHKATLRKSMTVAEIRKLERVVVKELEDMQHSNTNYRARLDEANARVKTQQEKLVRLQADVDIDFLTNVHNRRSLDSRVAEEIDRAARYGGTFSLIILDIDRFKSINDVHGHLAGDRVIRAVAKLLREQTRASDFLARYGGDEFVLLLPESTAEQARMLAEKTCKRMARTKFYCERRVVHITLSAGVGQVMPREDTPETLFARVDEALYRAKQGGRNRVKMASVTPP